MKSEEEESEQLRVKSEEWEEECEEIGVKSEEEESEELRVKSEE